MLSFLLLLIGVVDVAASFAAKSPPRFDVFSEKLVGKWLGDDGVDEVMRSCGGAVQGIRELQIFSSLNNDDERPYHNRANDGFVYFDCGSYSSGPTNLKINENDVSTNRSFMTSLSLPSTSRRTVLTASITVDGPDLSTVAITNQSPSFISLARGGDLNNIDVKGDILQEPLSSAPENIQWEHEVICRMPSVGQPWMLQRAKWDQYSDSDDNIRSMENGEEIQEIGWVQLTRTKDSNIANQDIFKSPQIAETIGSKKSTLLQMGTICEATKRAKAVVRCYQDDGEILSVILQSGYIIE